jgi:sarcosine oxidase subunit gamma
MADAMPGAATPSCSQTEAAALRRLPRAAQFVFRGDDAAASEAGRLFGVPLPTAPCRSAVQGARAALWQGPDEWLLVGPADEEAALEAALQAGLADLPHALVGVGHRNAMLELAGPRAADMLNAGCPLDLDEAAFPPGACSRTILARAPILLWRTGRECFTVGAWRSFMPYVWDFLTEARERL